MGATTLGQPSWKAPAARAEAGAAPDARRHRGTAPQGTAGHGAAPGGTGRRGAAWHGTTRRNDSTDSSASTQGSPAIDVAACADERPGKRDEAGAGLLALGRAVMVAGTADVGRCPSRNPRRQPVVRIPIATRRSGLLLVATLLAACGSNDDNDNGDAPAPAPAPVQQAKSCAELVGLSVPATAIGLPTTGAVVTSAQVVPAAGTGAAAVGEYCKVLGDIDPVDPNAPKIKFQVNLPTEWNRKAMMFGGGGYNGTIATGTGNVSAGPTDKQVPLGRGYATYGSDSGHQAGPTTSRDGSFGSNDEALRNFAGDALKKTRDAARAVINARYAADPERTYFAGGSTGGREALLAVGNWPQDFDGAIVLYPAWNATALNLHLGRMTQALARPDGYPNRAQRKVLRDAALEACDALDGATDGLISNQAACDATFDPATATLNGTPIACPGGTNADTCLTPAMIESMKAFDSPTVLSYTLPSGENGYPGFTTWGTDLGIPADGMTTAQAAVQPTVTSLTFGTVQPANPMPPVGTTSPPYGSTFWDQWVKFFVTRDPNANPLSLDPVNPGSWQQLIVELNGIQDANRTDFSAFRAKGGKILMAHGVHDGLVSNRATQQFMRRVRATMGDTALEGFVRYYEIPGYNHAVSSQFNAAWDSLTTLENWVERGQAPAAQVVTDTVGVHGRTRPLCEYPSWPRYGGTGDVNAASSFTCATR
jgi:feruloyl esterase